MKETGIIFSTLMVQAYQQGRKTQTRRLKGLETINQDPDIWAPVVFDPSTGEWVFTAEDSPGQQVRLKCPFGDKDDRLWVRETWQRWTLGFVFKSSFGPTLPTGVGWKPSIHMPKSGRYFLEVISIRPQRLQDISENDAKAEGVERLSSYLWKNYNSPKDKSTIVQELSNPKSSFESLWRSIHGNGSWALNPWVWRIEFPRCNPLR